MKQLVVLILFVFHGLYLLGTIYIPVNQVFDGFLAQKAFCQEGTEVLNKAWY